MSPQLGSAFNAGAESPLPKILHDDGGGCAADVGGEQTRLKIIERGLIDLTGKS